MDPGQTEGAIALVTFVPAAQCSLRRGSNSSKKFGGDGFGCDIGGTKGGRIRTVSNPCCWWLLFVSVRRPPPPVRQGRSETSPFPLSLCLCECACVYLCVCAIACGCGGLSSPVTNGNPSTRSVRKRTRTNVPALALPGHHPSLPGGVSSAPRPFCACMSCC